MGAGAPFGEDHETEWNSDGMPEGTLVRVRPMAFLRVVEGLNVRRHDSLTATMGMRTSEGREMKKRYGSDSTVGSTMVEWLIPL